MRKLTGSDQSSLLSEAHVTTIPRSVFEAAIIVAVCSIGALAFNAIRENGIDFIQKTPYQILVPCPEIMGEADELMPLVLSEDTSKSLIIDARDPEKFKSWQVPQSINVPFDYLESVSQDNLNKIASSGAQRVIVYGDGYEPDSGEQLAKEIAGKGIKNVGFIKGGAPALQTKQGGENL